MRHRSPPGSDKARVRIVKSALILLLLFLSGYLFLVYRFNEGDSKTAFYRASVKEGIRDVRAAQDERFRMSRRYAGDLATLRLEAEFRKGGVVMELFLAQDSLSWSARARHVELDSTHFCAARGGPDVGVPDSESPNCSWDVGGGGT